MSADAEEEIPEAEPRSDIEHDERLDVEGGTLVWRDPVASGDSIPAAYVWPLGIICLIFLGIVAAL